jgi:Tfp pilus assembly protein PilF
MSLSGPAKTTLFFLLFFKSLLAFAEDPTIDSLKNVLSKLQDSPEKVQTLLELGQNYLNTSIEDAVAYATAAKDLSGKIGYDKGLADAYRLLGVYYKKWGKYRESLGAYTWSLDIYRKMKDLAGQSRILNNLGSLYAQGQARPQ